MQMPPKSCLQPRINSQPLSLISSNLLTIFSFTWWSCHQTSDLTRLGRQGIACRQAPIFCFHHMMLSLLLSSKSLTFALQFVLNLPLIPLSLHRYPSSGSYDFISAPGSRPQITPPPPVSSCAPWWHPSTPRCQHHFPQTPLWVCPLLENLQWLHYLKE